VDGDETLILRKMEGVLKNLQDRVTGTYLHIDKEKVIC